MSEKEKKIIETFEKMVPKMNDGEVDKLLTFTEGMMAMKEIQKKESDYGKHT